MTVWKTLQILILTVVYLLGVPIKAIQCQIMPVSRLWAKELGIEFIVAPYIWFAKGYQSPCLDKGDCPITDELWKKVRKALTKGHTYVHCSAGVDRTSAIVSRWTLEADPNATPTSVIADAESYKHGWASGVNQQHYFDDWILQGKPSASTQKIHRIPSI